MSEAKNNQKVVDNRANQLNPAHEEYLHCRGENLSQADVSLIQQTEYKSTGTQSQDGLGAKAQRLFHQNQNSQKKGGSHKK